MDREKSLSEYLNEIKTTLEETYPGSFYYSGSNDTAVVREWYSLEIPLGFVLLTLSEEKLPKRFSLKDVRNLVKNRFKNYAKEEAKKALKTLKKDPFPYLKLDKLYKILKSVLLEVGVEDLSILEKLRELKKLEDIRQIENELIRFEETFYEFLSKKSPLGEKCKEVAEKKLSPYRIYWHKKVLQLTEKALIKKCLKEAYGIPDFTIL